MAKNRVYVHCLPCIDVGCALFCCGCFLTIDMFHKPIYSVLSTGIDTAVRLSEDSPAVSEVILKLNQPLKQ